MSTVTPREMLSLALLYKMPVLSKSNWKEVIENGKLYYVNLVTDEKQSTPNSVY